MHITVIGTGYVGLVTGACFTQMGNHVTCIDIDEDKLERLNRGEIPIYEPGLEEIVRSAQASELIEFHSDLPRALKRARYVFIAVGTPPGEDGSADLQHVLRVAEDIGRHLEDYAVVINKSTVPVGTAERVEQAIAAQLEARGVDLPFDVVSNPEFLKEGAAVEDFMRPDRVIVGTHSERAREHMSTLYAPYLRSSDRLMFMGPREAEMTKYAANAMLASRISFMNEVAGLCDHLGVDVESVRLGIGSDRRIGYAFIYPGAGYGGSCFPKDVKALMHMCQREDYEPLMLQAVEERNQRQKSLLYSKLHDHFGGELKGRHIGVWGLAFKPGTDDMREASSVVLIRALVEAGATVAAYDPVALEAAAGEFPQSWLEEGRLQLMRYQYDVARDADALVLVTEWLRFRQPDFEALRELLRQPILFDGRNQYDPEVLARKGFHYRGIGRTNEHLMSGG